MEEVEVEVADSESGLEAQDEVEVEEAVQALLA